MSLHRSTLRFARHLPLIILSTLLFLLSACASAPKKTAEPAFWPPAPSYPRVQYLMGINSSADLQKEEGGISLFSALFGGGELPKPILKPYGIYERDGVIYVADTGGGRVIVIDIPSGEFSFLAGTAGLGQLKKPVNLAVDREGFVYVADTERREVLVYGPDGSFLNTYGRDQDMKPVAVGIGGDSLYVVDSGRHRIVVFDRRSGVKTGEIGAEGDPAERLVLPTNMAVDQGGFIYTTNAGTGKIMVHDRDGHFVRSFGDMGDAPGMFARPRGVAVDTDGNTYAVDAGFQRVNLYNKEGRLLMTFGGTTSPRGGMNLPAGIVTSNANLDFYQKLAAPNFKLDRVIFVTNQYGRTATQVAVYGLGKDTTLDYDKEYERLRQDREQKAKEMREQKEKQQKEKELSDKKAKEGTPAR
jgi:DNA-binding beta-propeller fold protein YncE